MPRGRPRKNTAEAELLPPEENNQSQVRVKEVKHKTEWVELHPVEEAPEDDTGSEEIEIEDRPRRKTSKNERDELRKKLAANNVTPGSALKITIEKYLHSEAVDGSGGMFAETEHCAKYTCSEAHITGEDYLDVARKFGPGLYRFTLRMQNKIVTAWDKRISGGMAGTVIQQTNPADPNSPQVIVQMPEGMGAQQPVSVVDPWKQMREAAKFYKELKQTFESDGAPSQQQSRSEEEVLTSAILNRPEVVDNLVGSVLKRVGGKGGSDDGDPWANVAMEVVKSGQAPQIVRELINGFFNGFGGLFPGRQNNGQAPMATTPLQNQTQPITNNQQSLSPITNEMLSQMETSGLRGQNNLLQGADNQNVAPVGTPPVSPEQHALSRLIENCARRVPVQVAYQQLMNYADAINEQAPDYSIDGYIDLLGSMPTDQVIEFVKTLPNGEQVASLEWAKDWTASLQQLIKENQEGEE